MPHADLPRLLRAALLSGAGASLASAIVLAMRGRRELGSAATPLNGPSQWVWGRRAPFADGFSIRHTVAGFAVHHLAATFWAVGYEALRLRWKRFSAAAATAATASLVDLKLTPPRLRPGFERRLSGASIAMAYAAFAMGLAITARSRPR